MSDVTKMTVEELYNLVHDFPRSLESDNAWPEILRRLKRLEKCEKLQTHLSRLASDRHTRIIELETLLAARPTHEGYAELAKRLEKCEAALRKLALDLGPLGKIARAAVEE